MQQTLTATLASINLCREITQLCGDRNATPLGVHLTRRAEDVMGTLIAAEGEILAWETLSRMIPCRRLPCLELMGARE